MDMSFGDATPAGETRSPQHDEIDRGNSGCVRISDRG